MEEYAMTLDQMRYFVTAAQLQNLSKAAEALHISQPSLSRSIARLEEELGTPLFCRQGRRVVLNEPGSRLLSSAQVVLRELDGVLVQLRTYAGGAGARLSVGLCGPDEPVSACLAAYCCLASSLLANPIASSSSSVHVSSAVEIPGK